MNWSDLAKTVIGLGAPILGNALGGPMGGAAGKILAEAMGASESTPAAVNDAIASKQIDLAAAAQTAEAQWITALAEVGKIQLAEVGQTMRAEALNNDPLQRWWRPLYALELTLLECPGFAAVLAHGLWDGKSDVINGFANLSGLLIAYIGARFGVLGVYVAGRSKEKQALISGEAVPSLVGELFKAIARRK